jgi:hypothetical protein
MMTSNAGRSYSSWVSTGIPRPSSLTEMESSWDCHLDLLAVPCERLVYRVVDNLVDKMVKPPGVRRPDIHRRALLDCL